MFGKDPTLHAVLYQDRMLNYAQLLTRYFGRHSHCSLAFPGEWRNPLANVITTRAKKQSNAFAERTLTECRDTALRSELRFVPQCSDQHLCCSLTSSAVADVFLASPDAWPPSAFCPAEDEITPVVLFGTCSKPGVRQNPGADASDSTTQHPNKRHKWE